MPILRVSPDDDRALRLHFTRCRRRSAAPGEMAKRRQRLRTPACRPDANARYVPTPRRCPIRRLMSLRGARRSDFARPFSICRRRVAAA